MMHLSPRYGTSAIKRTLFDPAMTYGDVRRGSPPATTAKRFLKAPERSPTRDSRLSAMHLPKNDARRTTHDPRILQKFYTEGKVEIIEFFSNQASRSNIYVYLFLLLLLVQSSHVSLLFPPPPPPRLLARPTCLLPIPTRLSR